ncbi:AAA family ATPase [Nocardioides panacihumi]
MSSRAGSALTGEPYVVLRETHSAVVLLVGSRAFKFKKPVDLGFLDFSTLARREDACHREVELNRRLAPDVYDGVGQVRDEDGRTIEHLVLMRRMPDSRRLSRLVATGVPVDDELRQVARLVADFHTRCRTGPDVDAAGMRSSVARRWQNNFDESRAFRGQVLAPQAYDEVERLSARFLAGRDALFADRIARGAVVDGHGDLLADDIFCLPDGPRILDCLDFDDTLRFMDRIDDVACLVMDLERLGSPAVGRRFRELYVEMSGDRAPASLIEHYVGYRAFMRAKVTSMRAGQSAGARAEAQLLLDIAVRHLVQGAVSLIMVGGTPGTGKTTAAAALADELGAVVLSSDRVRKELAGLPAEAPQPAAFGEGIYTEEWSDRTHRELMRRAASLLSLGESVIIDATWADAGRRRAARELADASASQVVELRCDAPDKLADTRVGAREAGVSDADREIARELRTRFDPWPEARRVRTMGPIEETVRIMRDRVRPRPAEAAG